MRILLALAVPFVLWGEAPAVHQSVTDERLETANAQVQALLHQSRRNAEQNPAAMSRTLAERAELLRTVTQTHPARALAMALPDDVLAEIARKYPRSSAALEERGEWTGSFSELFADDMTAGRTRRLHWLRGPAGNLQLHFAGRVPHYEGGSIVTVRGVRVGARIAVSSSVRLGVKAAAGSTCSPVGDQKVVALLVKFKSSSAPSLTAEEMRDILFGTAGKSLDGFWKEASYSKASASGDVFGWFDLDRVYDCDESDQLADAAIAAAKSTVDFSKYKRILIYYPQPDGGCDYEGIGQIGCSDWGGFQASVALFPTSDSWTTAKYVDVTVHEGGHNLGLGHANGRDFDQFALGPMNDSGVEYYYGDPFSAMGNAPIPGHYNASQKLQLGWLTDAEVTTVEQSGDFHILPLESTAAGAKALKVRRTAGRDGWLWVEYRQPVGTYDAALPEAAFKGPIVHYEDAQNRTGGVAEGETSLIDFSPGSWRGSADFNDAPLAKSSWDDLWTSRSFAVKSAGADGLTLSVTADSCATLSGSSHSHGSGLEEGTITVTAPAGCAWTVVSSAGWLTASPLSGTGGGTVTYRVQPNTGETARSAALAIGRKPFEITQAAVNVAPEAGFLYPSQVTGPAGGLDVWFYDENGDADVQTVRLNINSSSALAGGCVLEYNFANDSVRLAKDDGSGWLGPYPSSYASRLRNSQCSLTYAIGASGEVTAGFVFSSSFTGEKKIYGWAQDAGGLDSGWQEIGKWTVVKNVPPQAVSVWPASGQGYAQTFSFTVSDANGGHDVIQVFSRFAGTGTACVVEVWPYTGRVLIGDAYGMMGGQGTVQGASCAVSLAGSTMELDGSNLRVTLAMLFKESFAGAQKIQLAATDYSNAFSTYKDVGAWTVGAAAGTAPVFTAAGVVNAASFAQGAGVAPGEIVTIFGDGLAQDALVPAQYDDSGHLQNLAGETKVFFDDVQAPMIYSLKGQISAIVPYSVNTRTKIRVEYQGRVSAEIEVPVVPSAPGIFREGGGAKPQAVAVNAEENTGLNSAANRATRGKIVTFFATGEGQTYPHGRDGVMPQSGAWPEPLGDVKVTFGGVEGTVKFVGLVYAGVLQVNVTVPADAPAGDAVPLVLNVGGYASPAGTTIALK